MINDDQAKKKIISILLIALGLSLGALFYVISNSDEDRNQNLLGSGITIEQNVMDFIEIIVLAGGLTATGIGLLFSAKETIAARKERNLTLVGSFSSQLTALKDKERNLKSKKDCETYAQNFVDLVDQIAYLYLRKSLPDDVADFFENELSYALTMIEWMNNNGIEKKLIVIPDDNILEGKFVDNKKDPKLTIPLEVIPEFSKGYFNKDLKTITTDIRILKFLDYKKSKKIDVKKVLDSSRGIKDYKKNGFGGYQVDKQYPWTSLLERCIQKNIVPFETNQQLPLTMINYGILPSDERDKIMDVTNQYSAQITELKLKEKTLTTKNDCETYASNFVDLMDQIAYLYEKNTLPSETHEYFINDFEYALRMIVWLENNGAACELRKAIINDDPFEKTRDSRWKDLMIQYRKNKDIIKREKREREPIEGEIKKIKDTIKNNEKKIRELKEEIQELEDTDKEEEKKLFEEKVKERGKLKDEISIKEIELRLKEKELEPLMEKRQREFSWDSLIQLSKKNGYEPLDETTLPMPMQEYKELPDEVMDQTLELVKDYGDKISKLTLREQKLFEEKDPDLACELYANSYIDLLDNIAFLYNKKALSEKVTKYFENNFCYALTLVKYLIDTGDAEQKELPLGLILNKNEIDFAKISIYEWLEKDDRKNWIMKHGDIITQEWFKNKLKEEKIELEDLKIWILENKEILEKEEIEKIEKEQRLENVFDDKLYDKLAKLTRDKLKEILIIGDQYTWTDLMMWCWKNNLTPYDIQQLPPVMRKRGIDGRIKKLMEISDLSQTEKEMKDKCDKEIKELSKKLPELTAHLEKVGKKLSSI